MSRVFRTSHAPRDRPPSPTPSPTVAPPRPACSTSCTSTDDENEKKALRAEVVVLNMGVARAIAHRYRQRGLAEDDLVQAAYVGLVKAVNGFDPTPRAGLPVLRGADRDRRGQALLPRLRLGRPAAAPGPGAAGPDRQAVERADPAARSLPEARARSRTTSASTSSPSSRRSPPTARSRRPRSTYRWGRTAPPPSVT